MARSTLTMVCALCAWLFVSTARAQPCVCTAARPPAMAQVEADAVFEAQVTAITEGSYVSGPEQRDDGRWVSLLVIREWKGATAGTVRHVFTPTACAVPFEAGTVWLVYARHAGANHDLRTTRCHRTRPIAIGREDLLVLGIPGTQIPEPAGARHAPRARVGRAVRAPLRRGLRRGWRRGVQHRPMRRTVRRR